MPTNGVIFSDGIEADFIHFNSGSIAEIGIAQERALIVQKKPFFSTELNLFNTNSFDNFFGQKNRKRLMLFF
jgi:hypothetical protein